MASPFASFPMCYGTELTSRAIPEWQNETGDIIMYISHTLIPAPHGASASAHNPSTLHRVWPTDAERVQRELERPPPRQAHQRRCLHELRGRSTEARQVALRLQHHQGKLGAGRTHARTQFFKSSTLGARADPSTMHNQDSPCECGNLGLRSPLRRPPPPWPHRIPTSGAGNNRGAKPAARLRSADHPAWRRNLQCTNIQTGPVSGGPVRWFSMT